MNPAQILEAIAIFRRGHNVIVTVRYNDVRTLRANVIAIDANETGTDCLISLGPCFIRERDEHNSEVEYIEYDSDVTVLRLKSRDDVVADSMELLSGP